MWRWDWMVLLLKEVSSIKKVIWLKIVRADWWTMFSRLALSSYCEGHNKNKVRWLTDSKKGEVATFFAISKEEFTGGRYKVWYACYSFPRRWMPLKWVFFFFLDWVQNCVDARTFPLEEIRRSVWRGYNMELLSDGRRREAYKQ